MWYNLIIIIVLVILSGLFAGLTLALFSISLTTLDRKVRLGDLRAKKVYEIRKRGNLLLCTLLLGNVASYTVMAIFLGSITTGVIAGFVATALIFVFGEILPQAVFPRYALQISAKLSWLIWGLLVLFYPIAAPLAWVLNKVLGKEPPVLWSKEELGEIIKYHEDIGDGIIDKDEERIILGALSFSDIKVVDIMIPKGSVFTLESHTIISQSLFEKIKEKGYSRIPVYDNVETTITGILYSKDLIGISAHNTMKIKNLYRKNNLIFVKQTMRLDDLLNLLVYRKLHMAIIINDLNHFVGLVTLEDIMEEILKTELEDQKN